MILQNFLQNSLKGVLLPLALLFFSLGCHDSKSSDKQTPTQTLLKHKVLPLIAGANVIVSSSDWNVTLQTDAEGTFSVTLPEDLDEMSLLHVRVRNGTADNESFLGEMQAYILAKDLREQVVVVNMLTTITATRLDAETLSLDGITQLLSQAANDFLRMSINEDMSLDFRDLYSYASESGQNIVTTNPKFDEHIILYGVLHSLLQGGNLKELLFSDSDGDGIELYEEVMVGTDPDKFDSDADGFDDTFELTQGFNPNSNDSDFDGLSDYEEYYTTNTSPILSDSDADFLPDNIEIWLGSDPNNADENFNGIVDGLDGDPLFELQWHLLSTGSILNNTKGIATIAGHDLNILGMYKSVVGYDAKGYSSIIQVVDTGVESSHEDLDLDLERSFNAISKQNDPTAISKVSKYDKVSPLLIGHGTAVAGIAGAKANNNKGLRGVVPHAKIAGSNWLEEQSLYELERAWYSGVGANEILVSNNSWGGYFIDDTTYEEIMELASKELRDHKGRIFTFAAGNEREEFGNSNLSYVANNRFAIAVASLNHQDKYSFYSSPGSNIMVSAYGGERYYEAPTIATTLLMGQSYYENELGSNVGALTSELDTNRNYTIAMNGTSAATPMVTGVIALTLQACPDLSYRDVRWILAHTALKIDANDSSWIQNSSGLWHSINYGFGKVNGVAMVEMCRSKYFELLPQEKYTFVTKENLSLSIPDNNTSIEYTFEVTEDIFIEWLGLHFQSDHPYSGDLNIELFSPSGTATKIITPNEIRFDGYAKGFRFGSVAFMGEHSVGKWKVVIRDEHAKDQGTLKGLKLEIYGH